MPQVTTVVEPVPPEEAPAPAEWEQEAPADGRLVRANVPVNGVLTLQFRADEQIVEAPLGDQGVLPPGEDRPPWTVTLGQAGTKYPLVHVRVTRPGLTTSLTVATTKRLYVVDLKSVNRSKIRVIRWPDRPASERVKARWLPDPQAPAAYHVGYQICPGDPGCEGDKTVPTWRPVTAIDDGRKTYIFFPQNLAVMPAPMLRLIGPTGPEMTNARLIESVMVLDHLINQAELRLGSGPTAEMVTVQRETPRTIECPGDPACPIWPDVQARRQE
jgi:type IV secretory pathway VirB9-like protein